jgi:hypothetical protein
MLSWLAGMLAQVVGVLQVVEGHRVFLMQPMCVTWLSE